MQIPVAGRSNARTKADSVLNVLAATQLEPGDQVVRCTANTATDSYTVTLPPVEKCAGRIFSVRADIANAKAVTLADFGTTEDWTGDFTLDADEDGILLISDGRKWWVLDNQIA